MCGGEADVVRRVVIFRRELEGEARVREEGVEQRDDVAPAGDGEGAVLPVSWRGAGCIVEVRLCTKDARIVR